MAATPTPNAGQSTPEYLTLRKSYTSLVAHITPQTGDIGGALFEKGYIPPAVLDYVTTAAVSNSEKAQRLVGALLAKVELDPSVYHGFISILKSEGQSADIIVEQLEEAYKATLAEYDGSSEDSVPDPTVQNRNSKPKPRSPASPKFICPFCKKCSIKQFFSRSGCPMASKIDKNKQDSLFPYLDHSTLTENEQLLLKGKLMDDTTNMICLFADTEDSVLVSLEAQNVGVIRLRNFAENLVKKIGTKEDIEYLQRSASVAEVFYALQPFKSFFNYEVIERIAKKFGSSEDRQLMEEYVSKFNQFCERSVFEVPPNIFHDSDPRPGEKVFSIKFTPEEHASLGDIAKVRRKLANILGIDILALQLCSISDGCVCLRFLISAQVAEEIFPLSQSVRCALDDIHVRIHGRPQSFEESRSSQVIDKFHTLSAYKLQTCVMVLFSVSRPSTSERSLIILSLS